MRHFIVGDIHGCYDEFLMLLQKAQITEQDFIISVGDIIDRGAKSIQIYNFFKNRPKSKVLMGNHERKHLRGVYSYAQDIVKLQFGEQYTEFVQWCAHLDYYYETPEAIIVHAALDPSVSLAQQKEEVLAGTTAGDRFLQQKYPDSFWYQHYNAAKPIIFGHHVVGDSPMILDNTIYGIDTGACHGGYLTGISLPDFKIYQVKVNTDYWAVEKKKWQLAVLKAKDWNNWSFNKIEKELQLFKKRYSNNTTVAAYLDKKDKEITLTKNLVKSIVDSIQTKTITLNSQNFNAEAKKFSYAPLFYIARANRLTPKVILAKYHTPNKLLALYQELCEKS